ncbi:histidine phosphatase family protein [Rhodoferax aquaticus]|uniref:Histidine phosphatase family protein n=1 Tax=Rhodoferax aquaticus TaxID=2527691 RepID=A0A515EW55_9BURK|nr:histidine phosphatase family protein [Rhodoferax aquaticus]QDL56869.1 histidine phosphatase family protein [Rhodoferax aquaticus]
MSPTRIIAVRHGETDWNVATRLQGHKDIGLNARGRWQAEQVAQALRDEPIAAVYSSDLSRAHDTAQAIAAHNRHLPHPTVALHTGLRERGFGMFEGYTYAEIEANWPEASLRWRHREPHFAPPGGESPTALCTRVRTALDALAMPHGGELIVLVAHGGVLDMLYRLATQQSVSAPRAWELGNTAINRLLWTPESFTLVGWGDVQHLEQAALDESSV